MRPQEPKTQALAKIFDRAKAAGPARKDKKERTEALAQLAVDETAILLTLSLYL